MFVIIGLVILFVSIIIGYTMHGGKIAALMQINEFIIIGGAGLASMLISGGPRIVSKIIASTLGLLKGCPYTKEAYLDLLQLLYEVFTLARREGLLALESHAEYPEESDLFAKHPFFKANHEAVGFLADNLKLILVGSVGAYELSDLMDLDLEVRHEEAKKLPAIINKTGDSMPGFGIVAAVLGVVITMQSIGGKPEEIGEKVAAALVGTFLGVLLAYGVFGPIGHAIENRIDLEGKYFKCIKDAVVSFAKGDSPHVAVEFARRNIEVEVRPTFAETETRLRGKKSEAAATEAEAKAA